MNYTKAERARSEKARTERDRRAENETNADVYISIIIPAYNEATRISSTLASVKRWIRRRQEKCELIVVDDGSTDATTDIVAEASDGFSELVLIRSSRNRGKGNAVKTGMLAAVGSLRLFMDADGSVPIDEIDRFIDHSQRTGADIVIGSIAVPGATVVEQNGAHRRALGSVAHGLIETLAVPGISDTQRGFKLFTSRAADVIFPMQTIDGFLFDIEILVIARARGFAVRELPVAWNNPDGSKVKLGSYIRSFGDLVRVCANAFNGKYSESRPQLRVDPFRRRELARRRM